MFDWLEGPRDRRMRRTGQLCRSPPPGHEPGLRFSRRSRPELGSALDKVRGPVGSSASGAWRTAASSRPASAYQSIRRAQQRVAGMAELRTDEPLVAFPGEVPTLLRDAVELLEQTGYSRAQLADELRWTTRHLKWILGEEDPRPTLRAVR